jgi:hypothetical protein
VQATHVDVKATSILLDYTSSSGCDGVCGSQHKSSKAARTQVSLAGVSREAPFPPFIPRSGLSDLKRANLDPRLGGQPLALPPARAWRHAEQARLFTEANAYVHKQACHYDFRAPRRRWDAAPHFFTWQAFNVLARWRCAARAGRSASRRCGMSML